VFIIILTSFCCGLGVYRWPFCFRYTLSESRANFFENCGAGGNFFEKYRKMIKNGEI